MNEARRLHEPSPQEREEALQILATSSRQARILANTAKAKLEEASPLLIQAIANRSGQGAKVEELLWSAWNGENKAGLCDCLCGLDTNLADAVLALLAARAHMGGDADPLLQIIISSSGSQPPEPISQHPHRQ